MPETTVPNLPAHVINAVGTLALHALANSSDPDQGFFLSCGDISVGPKPNDTHIGGWKVIVQRIEKPHD